MPPISSNLQTNPEQGTNEPVAKLLIAGMIVGQLIEKLQSRQATPRGQKIRKGHSCCNESLMKLYSTGDNSNNCVGQQESEQRYFQEVDVGRLCEWCPIAGYEMVQAHTNEFLNIWCIYLFLSMNVKYVFLGQAKTIYSMWNIRHLSIFLSHLSSFSRPWSLTHFNSDRLVYEMLGTQWDS